MVEASTLHYNGNTIFTQQKTLNIKKHNVDVHKSIKYILIMKILILKIHQLELASFHMKIM